MITVYSYTIYHSPNAYIGSILAARAFAKNPQIELIRRPLMIPKSRGLLVADLVGSHESPVQSDYHREDCERWAQEHDIELTYPPAGTLRRWSNKWRWDREELPARAYYATLGSGRETDFDNALFKAAWVIGMDVNLPATIEWAATEARLDGAEILARAGSDEAARQAADALEEFDSLKCPGVPTFVLNGQRFFGKDRVDWLAQHCDKLLREASA
ncbi:MAG: DsbA family protein [Parvibaculaceae bacterium]